METQVIMRRRAWQTPADLQASAARSTAVVDTVVVRPDPVAA